MSTPKDLIEFVAANRPEVLPGRIMIPYNGDCKLCLISADNTDNYPEELSDSHAAALLEHWLIKELKPWIVCYMWYPSRKEWDIFVHESHIYSGYNKNLLTALWSAYKAVKGEKR